MVDSAMLEQIANYDVPTIANAIELFGLRSRTEGFCGPTIRPLSADSWGAGAKTTIGYAVTATICATKPPTEAQKRRTIDYYTAVRNAPKPTIAVIQDLDSNPVGSFWGEVNATLHLALGCIGVVTNGGVRDLDEVRALGFRCFASCVLVSHGYVHLEEVGVPVVIDRLTVHTGDLIAGDQHGVVSIPSQVVHRLPEGCAHAGWAENPVLEPCRDLLKRGELADVDDLATWRDEMLGRRNSFTP